jgi:hypothetical protein
MSFLSRFLPPSKKGVDAKTPPARIERLQEALGKIEQERAAKDALLGAHLEKRRALLLADAPDESILAHDLEADRARLNVEKLDEAGSKIRELLEFESDVLAEQAWRKFYDEWYRLALECLEALQTAHAVQQRFLEHYAEAKGEYVHALAIGRVQIVHPGGLLQLDQIHAKEMRRREAMDEVIARRRAEEDA